MASYHGFFGDFIISPKCMAMVIVSGQNNCRLRYLEKSIASQLVQPVKVTENSLMIEY